MPITSLNPCEAGRDQAWVNAQGFLASVDKNTTRSVLHGLWLAASAATSRAGCPVLPWKLEG